MSTEEGRDENQVNEDGPGVNGDLGSWFYVLAGIPSMIIFFVVMFGVVGSCDTWTSALVTTLLASGLGFVILGTLLWPLMYLTSHL